MLQERVLCNTLFTKTEIKFVGIYPEVFKILFGGCRCNINVQNLLLLVILELQRRSKSYRAFYEEVALTSCMCAIHGVY